MKRQQTDIRLEKFGVELEPARVLGQLVKRFNNKDRIPLGGIAIQAETALERSARVEVEGFPPHLLGIPAHLSFILGEHPQRPF